MSSYCKIIQTVSGSSQKYLIICSKCKFDMLLNHIYFCYYHCISCKKKQINPNHRGYHSGSKCFFDLKKDIEKELEERNKPVEVKNLKHPEVIT